MSENVATTVRDILRGAGFAAVRSRPTWVAVGAFMAIFVTLQLISAGPISYYQFSSLAGGGATLALAAMGETLVILTGGFDLSAGAVISLVNVILATQMQESGASQFLWCLVGLGAGAITGAVNGFFVGFMRLPAIVVTLATMFIIQGITLLILAEPGGGVPYDFSNLITGDAIEGMLPMPIVVILGALTVWLLVRNSRFGTAIYAVGSDPDAARANGMQNAWTKFRAYTLAGLFYSMAGIFVTAQTGSGDPLIGEPLLLQIFAAVVLGGARLGGGRGGCVGSVFGAYTLMLVVNILLILNVSAYYSTIVEGVILILAVLGASLSRQSALADYLRLGARKLRAFLDGSLPPRPRQRNHVVVTDLPPSRKDDELSTNPLRAWFERYQDTLRFVLPAYGVLLLILIATQVAFPEQALGIGYLDSLLVLASFLAVLGLGQGAVILTGGLDLSVPWILTLCGVLLTGMVAGSDLSPIWAIPLALLAGTAFGFLNGAGVVFLGLSPIVMTLAVNGIAQGAALIYTDGTPKGWAPPVLQTFMAGKMFGLTPVAWALIVFVVAATLLLSRTTFGRYVYAVGNGVGVSRLSGVNVGTTLLAVYALSGFCSGLAGIMLTGFNGQAFNGMGDPYLLPSIAIVVVGGSLITGGRGHYLGIFGGALALTALGIALAGTTLPNAVRDIIYGLVVLGAILALRERQN